MSLIFDDVYIEKLQTIAPDIRVNKDWSKRKNIQNANSQFVIDIVVKPTLNPNVYIEVLTGIKIPVYRYYREWESLRAPVVKMAPKHPYYIELHSTSDGTYLHEANYEEVKAYIDKYSANIEEFREYLNKIIITSEEYYQNALLKDNYSDKAQIKSLIKKRKK